MWIADFKFYLFIIYSVSFKINNEEPKLEARIPQSEFRNKWLELSRDA